MENVRIIGCGHARAKHLVTNHDLEKVVDTSDEWIVQRTGIHNRYLSEDENTSDLAYRASIKAIEDAGIDKKEIDLIVVATMTPDNFTPSVACVVQAKLGLNDCEIMAFDINAACTGFIYAISVASTMLKNYKCALVIGAETLSKIVDYSDRNTCVLFGDGAGALLLKRSENSCLETVCLSIGDLNKVLIAEGLPLKKALTNTDISPSYLTMDGKEVFRFAINAMQDAILKVSEKAELNIEDIDLVIPHQANVRIINHVQKKLNLPDEKVYINLNEYGNTSAASVAIALSEAKQNCLVKEGMNLILTGFGAGFTYGAVYLKW
ncbi:MAG: beta-ketoacyl-ACP synthase III [Erysipelotrichaceae bacterium]|nr:beta-ketoacyl-ACP synthase III [Erysipelotrichaceae bacterium]